MVATIEAPPQELTVVETSELYNPEEKRLWLIDFDDTLIPYIENMLDLHNQRYDTDFSLDDVKSFILSESFEGYDNDYWNYEIDRQHDTGRTFNIPPHRFALEALASAADTNRYQILTSRKERYKPNMRDWLKLYDSKKTIDRDPIHMNDSDESLDVVPHDKGEIAKQLGAYALVDDHIDNIISADNKGVRAILFGDSIRVQMAVEKHKYLEHAEDWMQMWGMLRD